MDYFLNSENGTGAAHVTMELHVSLESTKGMPARPRLNERRTRASVGTNSSETRFTSSDLRGDTSVGA